jgi:hypothetical protein
MGGPDFVPLEETGNGLRGSVPLLPMRSRFEMLDPQPPGCPSLSDLALGVYRIVVLIDLL